MIGWIILSAILLLITLIIFIRVRLIIILKDESFSVKIRLLFLNFVLHDDGEQYDARKHKYSQRALQKQSQKILSAISNSQAQAEKEENTPSFSCKARQSLSLLSNFFESLVFPIFKKARVKFRYFKLSVSANDPADTAIIYGALCQGLSYLLNAISQNARISDRQMRKVKLKCDFLAEKTTLNVHAVISVNLWKLILAIADDRSLPQEEKSSQKSDNSQEQTELTVTS